MVVVGESKSNALVGVVEDGVILAHEHIAQDPQRPSRAWDVKTHEAQQADGAVRDQVVLRRQGVGLAVDLDVNVWLAAAASGQVLASVAELDGTDSVSNGGNVLTRSSDDGGTAVHDGGADLGDRRALDA